MPDINDMLNDAAEEESDDGEDFEPGGSPPASPEGEGDDLEDSSGVSSHTLLGSDWAGASTSA